MAHCALVNGFLNNRDDKDLLNKRLKQLLMDESLRQKMRDASERRFLRNFTFLPVSENAICLRTGCIKIG